MPILIGCPLKNDKDCFKEMMRSLLDSTKFYDKIIIVLGDNITDGSDKFAKSLIQFYGKKIEIVDLKSKTPLEAYNYLFERAKQEKADLFLTQTDVVFPKLYKRDWLSIMNQVSKDERIGAVTCLNGGGVSGPDYVDGLNWLGGWCVYYPYRTLEKVGGFDEGFPNGNGVDIDHSYRIRKEGLFIVSINYWVDHHMMNERPHDRNPNAEADRIASSNYFKQKWGLN